MFKVIRDTSAKFKSIDWVAHCSTEGKIDVAKIKATFPHTGAEFYSVNGKIAVKGPNRARTLFGDLKKAGFKVRWLPGFGWGKDSVGCRIPREDMRFVIG